MANRSWGWMSLFFHFLIVLSLGSIPLKASASPATAEVLEAVEALRATRAEARTMESLRSFRLFSEAGARASSTAGLQLRSLSFSVEQSARTQRFAEQAALVFASRNVPPTVQAVLRLEPEIQESILREIERVSFSIFPEQEDFPDRRTGDLYPEAPILPRIPTPVQTDPFTTENPSFFPDPKESPSPFETVNPQPVPGEDSETAEQSLPYQLPGWIPSSVPEDEESQNEVEEPEAPSPWRDAFEVYLSSQEESDGGGAESEPEAPASEPEAAEPSSDDGAQSDPAPSERVNRRLRPISNLNLDEEELALISDVARRLGPLTEELSPEQLDAEIEELEAFLRDRVFHRMDLTDFRIRMARLYLQADRFAESFEQILTLLQGNLSLRQASHVFAALEEIRARAPHLTESLPDVRLSRLALGFLLNHLREIRAYAPFWTEDMVVRTDRIFSIACRMHFHLREFNRLRGLFAERIQFLEARFDRLEVEHALLLWTEAQSEMADLLSSLPHYYARLAVHHLELSVVVADRYRELGVFDPVRVRTRLEQGVSYPNDQVQRIKEVAESLGLPTAWVVRVSEDLNASHWVLGPENAFDEFRIRMALNGDIAAIESAATHQLQEGAMNASVPLFIAVISGFLRNRATENHAEYESVRNLVTRARGRVALTFDEYAYLLSHGFDGERLEQVELEQDVWVDELKALLLLELVDAERTRQLTQEGLNHLLLVIRSAYKALERHGRYEDAEQALWASQVILERLYRLHPRLRTEISERVLEAYVERIRIEMVYSSEMSRRDPAPETTDEGDPDSDEVRDWARRMMGLEEGQ